MARRLGFPWAVVLAVASIGCRDKVTISGASKAREGEEVLLSANVDFRWFASGVWSVAQEEGCTATIQTQPLQGWTAVRYRAEKCSVGHSEVSFVATPRFAGWSEVSASHKIAIEPPLPERADSSSPVEGVVNSAASASKEEQPKARKATHPLSKPGVVSSDLRTAGE